MLPKDVLERRLVKTDGLHRHLLLPRHALKPPPKKKPPSDQPSLWNVPHHHQAHHSQTLTSLFQGQSSQHPHLQNGAWREGVRDWQATEGSGRQDWGRLVGVPMAGAPARVCREACHGREIHVAGSTVSPVSRMHPPLARI